MIINNKIHRILYLHAIDHVTIFSAHAFSLILANKSNTFQTNLIHSNRSWDVPILDRVLRCRYKFFLAVVDCIVVGRTLCSKERSLRPPSAGRDHGRCSCWCHRGCSKQRRRRCAQRCRRRGGPPCLLARRRHLGWKRKTCSVVAAASSAKPNWAKGD